MRIEWREVQFKIVDKIYLLEDRQVAVFSNAFIWRLKLARQMAVRLYNLRCSLIQAYRVHIESRMLCYRMRLVMFKSKGFQNGRWSITNIPTFYL